MYLFGYGVMAATKTENVLMNRGLGLVSDNAWVKGVLFDTGLGFPAMTDGEETVYGQLYSIEEETLQTYRVLAKGFDELNPPHQFELKQVTVFTTRGDYEALTFMYDTGDGLEKIPSGVWK